MTSVLSMLADFLDPPTQDVFALLGYTPDVAQQRFHDAEEFDVGYGGLAGAGKSLALLMEAVKQAVNHPGMRIGIFRRSFDELEESILSKVLMIQDALNEHFGATFVGSPRPELRFRNGSDIRFRYAETLQDATRRQGGEYQLIGIDERQQVTPTVPQYLETRIRSGRPGVPVIGIRSTFNPGDIGHADLKERYIERTGQGVHTYEKLTDNGERTGQWIRFVPGERSTHINASYWSQLASIADPVLRRQLAEGDWDAGGGLMFSETWRRHIHVVSPDDVPIPRGAGVIRARGIDYGMSAPFCCLWGAKLTDDLVVVYREVYERNLTPTEQAELILRSEAPHEKMLPLVGHLDPSCWTQYANVKRTPGVPAKSIASDYAKTGVRVVRAHNDRVGGVRLVHDGLRVRKDGMPRLIVYDTCPNLIKQLGGLPRSKSNPEDVDTHAEDHAYDALRYLLVGLLGKTNTQGDTRGRGWRPETAGLMGQAF